MEMERRGILSVEPSHALLPESPSAMETAIGTAKGLYDVIGKHYENKYKAGQARNENLQANLRQGTLASDILAGNTKNQADTLYYPKELQAKIGEVMARTGLSQAEAKAAIARSSESYALAALHNATRQNTGMQGQLLNQYIKDQRFGSNRSGAGGTYVDPETGQVISTPTNSTTTKNQAAIQATERVQPLIKDLVDKKAQFQTLNKQASLQMQRFGNLFGGNYDLPTQYAQSNQDLELAKESMLKAYGLNVTDDSQKSMERALNAAFMPGVTAKGSREIIMNTLNTIKQNQQEAMNTQSQGFNVTPNAQVAGGFNGNPNVQSQNPQQQQESRQIGDQSFVKINGKWYHQ